MENSDARQKPSEIDSAPVPSGDRAPASGHTLAPAPEHTPVSAPRHDAVPTASRRSVGVRRSRRRNAALLVLLLAAALALRVAGLGGESFWVDEVFSARIVEGAFEQILDRIPRDKPPLDYYLQALAHPLGPPEISHRIHALIASVFAIFGVWFWASAGFGRRAGLLAAVLAAFHFTIVYYAQEARPYSLLMALAAWQQGVFLVWWRRVSRPRATARRPPLPSDPARRRAADSAGVPSRESAASSLRSPWPLFVGLCILNLLLVFTMYSALILLAAEAVFLLLASRGAKRFVAPLAWFILSVVVAIAPAVLLLWSRAELRPPRGYFWQFQGFDALQIAYVLAHPLLSTRWHFESILAAAISVTLLALGFRRGRAMDRPAAFLLLLGSVLPLLMLPLLYAHIDRQYFTRYAAFCIPGCCILYALGIQGAAGLAVARARVAWRQRPAAARRIVFALAGVFLAVSVVAQLSVRPSRPDWRAAARRIAQGFQPGDRIVTPGHLARISLAYYVRRFLGDGPQVLTQEDFNARSEPPGRVWMVAERFGDEVELTAFNGVDVELQGDRPGAGDVERLRAALGDPPTLWMRDAPPELLGGGWSLPETWSPETTIRWAVRRRAVVFLPLRSVRPLRLSAAVYPHPYEGAPVQTVAAIVNGRVLETQEAPIWVQTVIDWQVPAEALRTGVNEVVFEFGHIRSPSELKKNYGDFRTLAAAVEYIRWRPAGEP